MASDSVPAVVSCEWLKQQIDSKNEHLLVLDVTWYSSKDAEQLYKEKHLPGAVYLNPFQDAEHTDLFPRNVPAREKFEALLQGAGLTDVSHVILYDSEGQNGYFIAGRARWHFKLHGVERVSILDGGLQRWESLGYPVTDVLPDAKKSNFKVKYNEQLRLSFEELTALQMKGPVQVADSRGVEVYEKGHIPGTSNIPFKSLFDGGVMKSETQLRKMFKDSGVDLSKPVITHCNSGMSSCTLALAAEVAGCPTVSVFHGGMTEWKAKAPDQIEKK